MVQVIINGELIGELTQENAKTFLQFNKLQVVSQTQYTINLER